MFDALFESPAAPLYVADRGQVVDATALIDRFGDDAGYQAAARAERSRNLGNAVHFCRWRQIERLIILMTATGPQGTLH